MPTTRTNENPPPEFQQVPSEFQILEASGTSDFQLEAADGEDGQSRKLRRFRMTAYTGGKLLLANFPYPVVVDLSGVRIPAKSRPILRDHDSSRIVGHTESIEINGSSIKLGGVVSGSNDHAREVSDSGDNGFPWQASIGATAQRIVFVDRGESVDVNGRKFTGPLYVARRSTLREVSFVALGADDQTVARMAANNGRSPESGDWSRAASRSTSLSSGLPSPVSRLSLIEVQSMEFEQWVAAQGFDADTLTEQQLTSLRAMYEKSREMGDGSPEPEEAGDEGSSMQAKTDAGAAGYRFKT